MSTNDNKNAEGQEIDLASVSKAFSGLFQSMGRSIFRLIQFVLKRIVVLGVLLALGFGIGLFLDKIKKTYNNSIIVRTNFGSSDYLYNKIDLLYSKINNNDTIFLKSIGIKDPTQLALIEIHPVVDIYGFIRNSSTAENDHNLEVLKLMSEDSDMKTLIMDRTTSKNYDFHVINFIAKSRVKREDILEPLLKYLENNQYFNNAKAVYIENSKSKIEANKAMIAQIDGLLSTFTKENLQSGQSDKSVYINENSQINDLIKTKDAMVGEIGYIKRELQSNDKVIKESSSTLNVYNTRTIAGKFIVVLPAIFILLYLLIIGFVNFYKKQAALNYEGKL
jgi:hypothetical protein